MPVASEFGERFKNYNLRRLGYKGNISNLVGDMGSPSKTM